MSSSVRTYEFDENVPVRKNTVMLALERLCCVLLIFVFVFVSTSYGSFLKNSSITEDKEDEQKFLHTTGWTWYCINDRCERHRIEPNKVPTSQETCTMTCGMPPIWPKPKKVSIISANSSTFNRHHMFFEIVSPKNIRQNVKLMADLFMENLPLTNTSWLEDVDISLFQIYITVVSNNLSLKISTDESYKLTILRRNKSVLANIFAQTSFGARHALETLSQLIWYDPASKKLNVLHDVEILDAPSFPHRGVQIDTARNFFSPSLLKRVIDGMSMNKLNVLHLHLTDSTSFPVELPQNKEFAKFGAYSEEMVYSQSDLKNLIEYALVRGIRTILEVDAPTHVNEGIGWRDDIIICNEADPLNAHLNPDNPKSLDVLQNIYEDLITLGTDTDTFHIGGDEVNITCWQNTKAAENFETTHSLWANFTNEMIKRVAISNNGVLPQNIVLWSSPLTDHYLPLLKYKENIAIQYWFGNYHHILEYGYKIIFSTVGQWYLDCGFGSWKPGRIQGSCDPYTVWQQVYQYRPWQDYMAYIKQVLGGEVCVWSEQINMDTLETRIWPRAAAFAERMWSDTPFFDKYDVSRRLSYQDKRMRKTGIKTSAIWPEWCSLNIGKC